MAALRAGAQLYRCAHGQPAAAASDSKKEGPGPASRKRQIRGLFAVCRRRGRACGMAAFQKAASAPRTPAAPPRNLFQFSRLFRPDMLQWYRKQAIRAAMSVGPAKNEC